MAEKRVKIKIEHKQKLFYEKFLSVWRDISEDRNQKCTIYKAIHSLKHYPLEVEGISSLKRLNGIGDVIALKCANAWSTICEERCTENLSLKEVKELSNEDYQKLVLQKGNKRKVNSPSIATKKSRACEDDYSEKIVAPAQPRASKIISDFDCYVHNDHETIEDVVAPITAPQIPYSQESVSSIRSESISIEYLSCQPFQQPEIILICDNREHHGNKRGKTVVEQLTKSDIRFELRSLSVGDYLWVARLIDGSELVLDWVVERKTWDDLKSSIRKGRYDEQKQRICKAPMKNRVYLIEGRGRGDVPCEQAIATTMIRDDFMIQRCESGLQTANFLAILTRKLIERSVKEELFGIKFEDLQDISKKTQVQTVQDVWTKQLTVCPGMSTTKAKTVASAFPSFSSMHNHYLKHGYNASAKLQQILPSIPRSLANQLSQFFS